MARHHPTKLKVTGSIPGQDSCLGSGLGPQSESVQETTDQCFSPSLSLSLPLSLKINKIFKITIKSKVLISSVKSTDLEKVGSITKESLCT